MNKKVISIVFGAMMVIIYTAMACLLLFSSIFDKQFPFAVRLVFGIIFFAYGLFRAYRIINEYNNE